jgi:biopolymer transport protein ExbB
MLFYQLIRDGGPVMWPILLCSVIAVFIFFEKWFHFHREQVNVGELVSGLINVLKRDGIIEALTLCDNTPGPAARILTAAIQAYHKEDENIRQALEDAALIELPKLESRLKLLGTIAYITPLLGLLGTVLGMMGAFETIHAKQGIYLSATDLSGDIGMALITTAAGLTIAIPCYLAYNYLVSRVDSMTHDMEKASAEIIYFFNHHRKNSDPQNGS